MHVFSAEARKLLQIPTNEIQPSTLAETYSRWVAGRSYSTKGRGTWSFGPRGQLEVDGLDACVDHKTAQFYFGIDEQFRVFVQCKDWVQIASSVFSLIEQDALLNSQGVQGGRSGWGGMFSSFEEYTLKCRQELPDFVELPSPDPDFFRLLRGPTEVAYATRFYTDKFAVRASSLSLEPQSALSRFLNLKPKIQNRK